MKFLDYMKKYCNDDTTKVEKIIESKEIKMKKILESAFDDQYVSKEVALHRIQTEFIDDRIAPKSIDKTFLKENMKEVLSKVQKLTEGEIKIIINNDIDKSGVGRGMPTIDVVDSDDMPMEGKKRGRGRPPKSKVATLEEPKEVDEDNAVQTPVVNKKIDKLAEKDSAVVATTTDDEESDPNEVEPDNDEDDTEQDEACAKPKKAYAEYVDKFKTEETGETEDDEDDTKEVETDSDEDDEDDEDVEEGSKKLTWDEVAKYLDKEPMSEKDDDTEEVETDSDEKEDDDEDDEDDEDEVEENKIIKMTREKGNAVSDD